MDQIKILIEYKPLGIGLKKVESKLGLPCSEEWSMAAVTVSTFEEAKKIFTAWASWVAEITSQSVAISYMLVSNTFELDLL